MFEIITAVTIIAVIYYTLIGGVVACNSSKGNFKIVEEMKDGEKTYTIFGKTWWYPIWFRESFNHGNLESAISDMKKKRQRIEIRRQNYKRTVTKDEIRMEEL